MKLTSDPLDERMFKLADDPSIHITTLDALQNGIIPYATYQSFIKVEAFHISVEDILNILFQRLSCIKIPSELKLIISGYFIAGITATSVFQ